jgi:hypothetical protein
MRCSLILVLVALALATPALCAQRHSGSPPTAPPRPAAAAAQPIVPVSSGMGPIQYVAVNYGVPAPQSLTRQLRADDDRTRAAALTAVGAPGEYLQRGHIGMPRSIQLEFAALSNNDDLDAILTVELDQHIVTAILVPDDSNWRRVATVSFATPFDDPRVTPSTFVHTARSFLQRGRYRVIFRADSTDPHGNYIENEAHLRVLGDKAMITMSFASASRDCNLAQTLTPGKRPDAGGCSVMRRWFTPDPADPFHHFNLVTGTGHMNAKEAADALGVSRTYETAHLHTFSCQPFSFSDGAMRFEPTANAVPCQAVK